MNNIKHILLGFTIALYSIVFTACGDGDNASFSKNNGGDTPSGSNFTKVTITECDGENSFTTIQSGDVLVAPNTSSIDLRHLSDGNKKVCVLNGSAYLKR